MSAWFAPGWPAPQPIDLLLETRRHMCRNRRRVDGPAEDGAPTHLAGLPHGLSFVEALAGLAALPPRGAWSLFMPIRLVGGTGGPPAGR